MQGMVVGGFVGEEKAGSMAQARGTHHPFGGDPIQAKVGGQPLPELPIRLAMGGKFSVGPFTGHGHQARRRRDAVGHPQARAGADHQQGTGWIGLARLDGGHLGGTEMGKAIDQHGEIIDQLHLGDARRGGELVLIQPPGQVGELGFAVAYRSGHGKTGGFGSVAPQKFAGHRGQVGPVGGAIVLGSDAGEGTALSFAAIEPQEGLRTTDIASKNRGHRDGGVRPPAG